jgi:hypothetical protein
MDSKTRISLPVAALSFALLVPGLTYAQSETNSPSSQVPTAQSDQLSGQEQAAKMVPARAYLKNKLDSKDSQPGAQFTAILAKTVRLKNGRKLDSGTKLVGTVTADDMQVKGTSKLALRLTEAQTKDGKTIPIKATIVGVYAPGDENMQGYVVAPGDEQPNDWTRKVLSVDEIGALSGVDLHSRIAGQNSGVFVSQKKDDVKLAAGSELALAIAEQDNGHQQTGSNGGS